MKRRKPTKTLRPKPKPTHLEPKPDHRRYRNLSEFRGTVWYRRLLQGHSYKVNTGIVPAQMADWDRAAAGNRARPNR